MLPKEIQRSLRSSESSVFQLSIATTSEMGQQRLAYAQLEFVRTDMQRPRPEADLDYGVLHLRRTTLSTSDGEKILEQLYAGQQLSIPDLSPYSPMTGQNPPTTLLPSRSPHWSYSRIWPLNYTEFQAPNSTRSSQVTGRLVGAGLPFFPSGGQAIRDFFELGSGANWNFGNYGYLVVIVPDYRARIEEFKIGYQRIAFKVGAGLCEWKNLRVEAYVENESKSIPSDELKLDDGQTTWAIPFDPSHVIAVLLDARDNSIIDQREWFPGYVYPDYVNVERPAQQIRDLIAAGEGKRIEFKTNLDDKDDFLETVVAFANSEGGLIILGMNDNRVSKGFKGDAESIAKMIRDSCEPLIEPSFKEYELDGLPLLAVEIPIGGNKPYMMKNKGIIYVRVGPNDVPATRSDLDQLIKQPGTSGQFARGVLQ